MRSSKSKAAIVFVNQGFILFAGLINTYVISQHLTPTELGGYYYFINLFLLLAFFNQAGHSNLTFKRWAVGDANKNQYFGVNVIIDALGLAVAVIALGIFLVISPIEGSISSITMSLIILETIIQLIFLNNLNNINNATNNVESVQKVALFQACVTALSLFFVLPQQENIESLALIYALKALLGSFAIGFLTRKALRLEKALPSRNRFREFWNYIKPMILASLVGLVFTRLGSILVGVHSQYELGLYAFATKYSVITLSISAAVTTIVFSKMSVLTEQRQTDEIGLFTLRATRIISILTIGAMTSFYLASDFIFSELVGNSFAGAKEITWYLAGPIYVTSLARVLGYVLWANESTLKISRIQLISRAVGISCLFLLIPDAGLGLGALGLPISMTIAGIIALGLNIYENKKLTNLGLSPGLILHFLAASIAFLTMEFYVTLPFDWLYQLFIKTTLAMLIYLLILICFRQLTMADARGFSLKVLKH